MDKDVVALLETIRDMDTTSTVAAELDKVIQEVGCIDGTKEMVAAVVIAFQRSGKGAIKIQNTN